MLAKVSYFTASRDGQYQGHQTERSGFSHNRALQFGKAQQTAMTLHRLKGYKIHDYQWWIVTCLVLQARQAGSSHRTRRLHTVTLDMLRLVAQNK